MLLRDSKTGSTPGSDARGAAHAPLATLIARSVLFFGGKGGVGKTTCASATALAASRMGKRVLLVSTDPAHSTADIFARPIGPDPIEILPSLFAMELIRPEISAILSASPTISPSEAAPQSCRTSSALPSAPGEPPDIARPCPCAPAPLALEYASPPDRN